MERKPEAVDRHDRLRAAGHIERSQDGGDMYLDSGLREPQFPADLLVGFSLGNECQHIELAIGESELGRGHWL